MSEFVKVAVKSDIPEGGGIAVDVNGKRIAIFNVSGRYYAIADECTHAQGPLSEGSLEGTVVTCPWHGATFDLANGKALSAPAFEDTRSYPVKVEGDDVKVAV